MVSDAALVRLDRAGGGAALVCERCPWWRHRLGRRERDMATLIRLTRAHLSTHPGGPLAHLVTEQGGGGGAGGVTPPGGVCSVGGWVP